MLNSCLILREKMRSFFVIMLKILQSSVYPNTILKTGGMSLIALTEVCLLLLNVNACGSILLGHSTAL